MIIKKIEVKSDCSVYCKSRFYSAVNGLSENSVYTFNLGCKLSAVYVHTQTEGLYNV